ncbi:VPLPA-CTERM sorting domain-containing protein [uncultured Roseobacter sp.]|uniref:VPLPA-CTERM sorting domain-containing protein n=1 Tax=uncultured Roseobacter sp. TaxID=114847 RepID=UPI002606CC64|nr:VPLPA-CTERM sorting domain-containing protein [uncultured Roseobacter sp.]
MKSLLLTSAATMLLATTSQAAIIDVVQTAGDAFGAGGSGAAEIIAAPEFALDDNVTNTHMQGFDEAQGVFLNAALDADAGIDAIAAGQLVNSHMIFLNTDGGARGEHFGVEWTFDGAILGVMSNSSGSLEFASTSILGAAGTTYQTAPLGARGLESNNGTGASPNDGYLVFAPNSIRVSMEVTEPGDWIRVVTAVAPVPIPATMPLLLVGLGGLGFVARRKRRASS